MNAGAVFTRKGRHMGHMLRVRPADRRDLLGIPPGIRCPVYCLSGLERWRRSVHGSVLRGAGWRDCELRCFSGAGRRRRGRGDRGEFMP